jgi:hypothetical protein
VVAGQGTQTASLAFGGRSPDSTAATEEYDGTSWTTVAGLPVAKGAMIGWRNIINCFICRRRIPYASSTQQQKNGQVQEHH